eukprot:1389320-Amorphochlora_amoeboformis.AAC.2
MSGCREPKRTSSHPESSIQQIRGSQGPHGTPFLGGISAISNQQTNRNFIDASTGNEYSDKRKEVCVTIAKLDGRCHFELAPTIAIVLTSLRIPKMYSSAYHLLSMDGDREAAGVADEAKERVLRAACTHMPGCCHVHFSINTVDHECKIYFPLPLLDNYRFLAVSRHY